jgi:aldehyde:ferredoxin oxidoreductase
MEEVEKAKQWYYDLAGWGPTAGIPSAEALRELGLEWLVDKWP